MATSRGPVAGGITETVHVVRDAPHLDQFPVFVGYSLFFAACCLAGALGGLAVSAFRRRR